MTARMNPLHRILPISSDVHTRYEKILVTDDIHDFSCFRQEEQAIGHAERVG